MRVLVTGASRGIGAAICVQLARSGAQVAACGSAHRAELQAVVAQITAAGGTGHALHGDLADPAVPAQLVDAAVAAMGGLDAVVSNAGIAFPGKLAETQVQDWDRVHAVNVRAPWLLAKAAYPHLLAAKGCVAVVASISGLHPYPGAGAYSASKAALLMLVRQLAQEWAADGLRVNAVSPGMVRTPLTEALYADEALRRQREALVPMHRIGTPEEVAHIVEFLLSPAGSYMTGQNIVVDGGVGDAIHGLFAGRPDTGAGART
jgi:glucose 1-dehydrogenase